MGSASAAECDAAACDAAELVAALTNVAAVQAQTRQLHEILGGFCHESRNRLNCLKLSIYLARRNSDPVAIEAWNELETRYQGVEQVFDRIESICRPLALSVVNLPLAMLFEDRCQSWAAHLAVNGKRLILDPPARCAIGGFDPIRLGQGFDDLVAWRARAADPGLDLRVAWSLECDRFHVVWDEPERRRSEGPGPSVMKPMPAPFTSLAVPSLTRIVTLHGGCLEVASFGPWRLDLRWPLDARNPQGDAP